MLHDCATTIVAHDRASCEHPLSLLEKKLEYVKDTVEAILEKDGVVLSAQQVADQVNQQYGANLRPGFV